jgi:hypothetical protein
MQDTGRAQEDVPNRHHPRVGEACAATIAGQTARLRLVPLASLDRGSRFVSPAQRAVEIAHNLRYDRAVYK